MNGKVTGFVCSLGEKYFCALMWPKKSSPCTRCGRATLCAKVQEVTPNQTRSRTGTGREIGSRLGAALRARSVCRHGQAFQRNQGRKMGRRENEKNAGRNQRQGGVDATKEKVKAVQERHAQRQPQQRRHRSSRQQHGWETHLRESSHFWSSTLQECGKRLHLEKNVTDWWDDRMCLKKITQNITRWWLPLSCSVCVTVVRLQQEQQHRSVTDVFHSHTFFEPGGFPVFRSIFPLCVV